MAARKTQNIDAEAQEQPKKTATRTATRKTPTTKKKAVKTKKKKPVQEIPEDIWEQWPEETTEQYTKFCLYRDMAYEGNPEADIKKGYAYCRKLRRRSIRKLVRNMGLKRATPFDRLSQKFHWQDRVEAYDLDLEKRCRAAHEAAIIKMTENHALLGEQMVKKAAKRILTMPEEEISAAEVARLADVGVRIERLSRGQSTENQQVTGTIEHEGSVNVKKEPEQDLSQLSDAELKQLEKLLVKAQVKAND